MVSARFRVWLRLHQAMHPSVPHLSLGFSVLGAEGTGSGSGLRRFEGCRRVGVVEQINIAGLEIKPLLVFFVLSPRWHLLSAD